MENNINNIWKTKLVEYCGPSGDRYSLARTKYKNVDFNVYFIVDRNRYECKISYLDVKSSINCIIIPPEIIYNHINYPIKSIIIRPLINNEETLKKLVINANELVSFYTRISINHVYIKSIRSVFYTFPSMINFVNSVYIENYNLLLKNI